MNLAELLQLKFSKADFTRDIQLADEGNDIFIRAWNLSEPMPTADDIAKWEIELDLPYRIKQATSARIYPSIQDQLDMLYHDKVDGTTTWIDTIKAVKDAHPKPIN